MNATGVLRWAALVVGLQLLALTLVAAAELVPDARVLDQLDDAMADGHVGVARTPPLRGGGISDHFGECILSSVGTGAGEHSWFETITLSPNLGGCEDLRDRLAARAAGEDYAGGTKLRYWNGLSTIGRPAIAAVGINGLRIGAAAALVWAFAGLSRVLARAIGRTPAWAFVAFVTVTAGIPALLDVWHHTLMFAIGAVGLRAVVSRAADGSPTGVIAATAFVAASAYNFFDLMNFVVGFWIASAILVGVVGHGSWRARARRVLAVGIAWPLGYGTMWIGRWFWAAVATSPAAVREEITSQIEFRVNGESQFASGRFGEGLRATGAYWLDQPLVVPALIVGTAIGIVALVVAVRRGGSVRSLTVVAIPAAVVPVWFVLANNHNEIHFWFEYRSFPLVVASLLAAALAAARGGLNESADRGSPPELELSPQAVT